MKYLEVWCIWVQQPSRRSFSSSSLENIDQRHFCCSWRCLCQELSGLTSPARACGRVEKWGKKKQMYLFKQSHFDWKLSFTFPIATRNGVAVCIGTGKAEVLMYLFTYAIPSFRKVHNEGLEAPAPTTNLVKKHCSSAHLAVPPALGFLMPSFTQPWEECFGSSNSVAAKSVHVEEFGIAVKGAQHCSCSR